MSQYHLRWGGLASLFWLFSIAIAPVSAQSDILFTQAAIDTFRNRVDIFLRGGLTRPVRDRDRLGFGDTLLTQQASQVDLRFNDGSQVRLGELSTFWFVPNTRDFRLGQGTALLRIPPGRNLSTVETPNVIAAMQGAAVVVRYVRPTQLASEAERSSDPRAMFATPDGRTAVIVLAENGSSPVQVSVRDGRSVDLSAGQLAIVDNENLYIFEFDLALFSETSSLVRGLSLELPDSSASSSAQAEAAAPSDFAGDYWLDPKFLSPEDSTAAEAGWLFPTTTPADADTAESSAAAEEGAPETLHNTSTTEFELAPPPSDSPPPDTQLTPPNSENNDDSDVPAGVIVPPASNPAPPATPAPPNDAPSPSQSTPDAGDRPTAE